MTSSSDSEAALGRNYNRNIGNTRMCSARATAMLMTRAEGRGGGGPSTQSTLEHFPWAHSHSPAHRFANCFRVNTSVTKSPETRDTRTPLRAVAMFLARLTASAGGSTAATPAPEAGAVVVVVAAVAAVTAGAAGVVADGTLEDESAAPADADADGVLAVGGSALGSSAQPRVRIGINTPSSKPLQPQKRTRGKPSSARK